MQTSNFIRTSRKTLDATISIKQLLEEIQIAMDCGLISGDTKILMGHENMKLIKPIGSLIASTERGLDVIVFETESAAELQANKDNEHKQNKIMYSFLDLM